MAVHNIVSNVVRIVEDILRICSRNPFDRLPKLIMSKVVGFASEITVFVCSIFCK